MPFPIGQETGKWKLYEQERNRYNYFILRHFIPVHLNSLEGGSAEYMSKRYGTSPMEGICYTSIIVSELQELFNPKGLPFLISLWDTHSLQLLEQIFCLLALRSFVFCWNLFSVVWLWHCSKAFNKHLNSFPCDKNHSHSSSCLVAAWHFSQKTMGFPPSLSVLK